MEKDDSCVEIGFWTGIDKRGYISLESAQNENKETLLEVGTVLKSNYKHSLESQSSDYLSQIKLHLSHK